MNRGFSNHINLDEDVEVKKNLDERQEVKKKPNCLEAGYCSIFLFANISKCCVVLFGIFSRLSVHWESPGWEEIYEVLAGPNLG